MHISRAVLDIYFRSRWFGIFTNSISIHFKIQAFPNHALSGNPDNLEVAFRKLPDLHNWTHHQEMCLIVQVHRNSEILNFIFRRTQHEYEFSDWKQGDCGNSSKLWELAFWIYEHKLLIGMASRQAASSTRGLQLSTSGEIILNWHGNLDPVHAPLRACGSQKAVT